MPAPEKSPISPGGGQPGGAAAIIPSRIQFPETSPEGEQRKPGSAGAQVLSSASGRAACLWEQLPPARIFSTAEEGKERPCSRCAPQVAGAGGEGRPGTAAAPRVPPGASPGCEERQQAQRAPPGPFPQGSCFIPLLGGPSCLQAVLEVCGASQKHRG